MSAWWWRGPRSAESGSPQPLRRTASCSRCRKDCCGAPDRCWPRVSNVRDPDRGARRVGGRGDAAGVRNRRLRGELPQHARRRQLEVLAAYVEAGGSVSSAAARAGVLPSMAKRHLAHLRARTGLTTEQLIYVGRAAGWLVVDGLEPR